MKKTSTLLLLCCTLAFIGCSDSDTQQEQPVVKTQVTQTPQVEEKAKAVVPTKELVKKDYTIDEIYMAMCIICHSSDGSGNTEKLTPSMRNLSQEEIEKELIEVEKDQGHIIMEHNRGKIIEMGMEYSAKDMASYMHNRFHK